MKKWLMRLGLAALVMFIAGIGVPVLAAPATEMVVYTLDHQMLAPIDSDGVGIIMPEKAITAGHDITLMTSDTATTYADEANTAMATITGATRYCMKSQTGDFVQLVLPMSGAIDAAIYYARTANYIAQYAATRTLEVSEHGTATWAGTRAT